MQSNEKYSIPLFFSDKDDEIKTAFNNLKDENHRLQLENDRLKMELEREQLLHKNLYNEWKELKSGTRGEKNGSRKIKRLVRKKSSFYGLFSIAILLSAFIFYLVFSDMAGTNTISAPIPADTAAIGTKSENKSEGLSNTSSPAKPAIKAKQKKNNVYAVDKKILILLPVGIGW